MLIPSCFINQDNRMIIYDKRDTTDEHGVLVSKRKQEAPTKSRLCSCTASSFQYRFACVTIHAIFLFFLLGAYYTLTWLTCH